MEVGIGFLVDEVVVVWLGGEIFLLLVVCVDFGGILFVVVVYLV